MFGELLYPTHDSVRAPSISLQPLATLDHRNAYYKRLLERYQRGDIHSVMPVGPEGD